MIYNSFRSYLYEMTARDAIADIKKLKIPKDIKKLKIPKDISKLSSC